MQFSDVKIWAIAYFTYRRKAEKVISFYYFLFKISKNSRCPKKQW